MAPIFFYNARSYPREMLQAYEILQNLCPFLPLLTYIRMLILILILVAHYLVFINNLKKIKQWIY